MNNLDSLSLQHCDLSISIVTYKNDPDKISEVLESLKQTQVEHETIIVDNSPESNIQFLCDVFPGVQYFHNPSNPGFGTAHNIAVSKSSNCKYHLILNPDVYFQPDVIPELLKYLDANQDVGLIQPKVYSPNGDIQYLCKTYPTFFVLFARRFLPSQLQFLLKDKLELFEMRETGYDRIVQAQYLSGCFMLFRRSCFDEIGGFDERIFLHMEDADITYRISQKYKAIFYPHVHIFHHWARGSHKSISQTINTVQSAFYFFNKHGWKII